MAKAFDVEAAGVAVPVLLLPSGAAAARTCRAAVELAGSDSGPWDEEKKSEPAAQGPPPVAPTTAANHETPPGWRSPPPASCTWGATPSTVTLVH